MYWLTFVAFSLLLYLPPLNLAGRLWQWAAWQQWHVLLVGWRVPPGTAYLFWLTVVYLGVATLWHLAQRRLPGDSRLGSLALRASRADLGPLGVIAPLAAVATLLLTWPLLPAAQVIYGWHYAISPPVAALAYLYLLAEGLRLAEVNVWADRAFAARRVAWLVEHGHYR